MQLEAPGLVRAGEVTASRRMPPDLERLESDAIETDSDAPVKRCLSLLQIQTGISPTIDTRSMYLSSGQKSASA